MITVFQDPAPGARRLVFRGDTLTFRLSLSRTAGGQAWLRTNIGRGAIARAAVIKQVEKNQPPLGTEWFDIPMTRMDDKTFQVRLPLLETGHFEAKALFIPQGQDRPLWPEGRNTTVNVNPAATCCANIVYNAFVRQFGPNRSGDFRPDAAEKACLHSLDDRGYAVIPPSGTFRDLIESLDFIIGELGCRVIQLLPIHPTPTTYARMGRFGSPYAALNFTGIDPALAVFDPKATPLEQFCELVDAVHARHALLLLDIAVNHTGWAAGLHETHPHWLKRDASGEIQVPGAWGVQWSDLTSLDYSRQDLWEYIAEVLLTWCRRGVDGFRCDAGYMIPVPAWRYITAMVREQFPETIFLLEGLGGKISVTRDILNRGNFNWAYSELFQNYDRGQIEHYLAEADEISEQDGTTLHFAETHDNNRLAARSPQYARMRTALCALFSHQGAFGFANGVEWLATEKIDVHDAASLNWGAGENQVERIRRLNILLRRHPAFFPEVTLQMLQTGEGNFLVLLRRHRPSGKELLVLVNLAEEDSVRAFWKHSRTDPAAEYTDLLTDAPCFITLLDDGCACDLAPGQVRCLTADPADRELFQAPGSLAGRPERLVHQQLQAKALEIRSRYTGLSDLGKLSPPELAKQLAADPIAFCRTCNPESAESRTISWDWPQDCKRQVMVPPDHFLLLTADHDFAATLIEGRLRPEGGHGRVLAREVSLPRPDGSFFALFPPLSAAGRAAVHTLRITVYEREQVHHRDASLFFPAAIEKPAFPTVFARPELQNDPRMMLATNGSGAMMRACGWWAHLRSKYDALLAANLHPDFPEDRWIMFSRCRAWVTYQGHYQEIGIDCLESFQDCGGSGFWHHRTPTGQGQHIDLLISAEMVPGKNAVHLSFYRPPAGKAADRLADATPVTLILRPDIDDRNFHQVTKAYTGPEHHWPGQITPETDGFIFSPAPRRQLRISLPGSRYVPEPEWQYMVPLPVEAERGLEAASDLFSPGYFSLSLPGGQTAVLTAAVNEPGTIPLSPENPVHQVWQSRRENRNRGTAGDNDLQSMLAHYVVRRRQNASIIAGYPWFLDWGRDSLIAARGLIAAGRLETAKAVVKQFGRFEQEGTLPNMICGEDAGNRDTSDAPLWFFTVCREIVEAEKSRNFLESACGGRTIGDILLSIARAYRQGTPNGIIMDAPSELIFSPAHYTWMDTNYPAGTPRQGYCIEIQALWHAALDFLAGIDGNNAEKWQRRAQRVRRSIGRHFPLEAGYLADCLHADPGQSAEQAEADDALRPNQLLAITLKAINDTALGESILAACQSLLVPGAIRSLADRPLRRPLAIYHHDRLVNDPRHPYQGHYTGDEDTRRKPAYHNGTAWTWQFPVFCEAWAKVYGKPGLPAARSWLSSSLTLLERGCVGHLPEILDGDAPHAQRGCDAQAWGLSEFIRVWKKLQ